MERFKKLLRHSVFGLAFVIGGSLPAIAVTWVDGIQFYPSVSGTAAPAGQVGEVQTLSVPVGSAVTYTTTATPYNLGSLTLTQGEWMCEASIIDTAAGTTFPSAIVAFNTVSATTGVGGGNSGLAVVQVAAGAPVTLYVVIQAAFTGTAPTAYGAANCTRER